MVDGKDYIKAAGRHMKDKPLSYREITLRWKYPADFLKLTPVLLFLMLPFSTVALIPVMWVWTIRVTEIAPTKYTLVFRYYFPQRLFTRGFWTASQRKRFDAADFERRFEAVPNVIAHLERNIALAENPEDRYILEDVLRQIKMKHVVPEQQILDLQLIFAQPPFSFYSLPSHYVSDLARLNGLSSWSVQKFPHHLILMDYALEQKLQTNSVDLTEEEIRYAALLRGCDPSLTLDNCIEFLTNWTRASSSLLGKYR